MCKKKESLHFGLFSPCAIKPEALIRAQTRKKGNLIESILEMVNGVG